MKLTYEIVRCECSCYELQQETIFIFKNVKQVIYKQRKLLKNADHGVDYEIHIVTN